MQATEEEKLIFGQNTDVEERDGICTVYQAHYADGSGKMTAYRLFPGIELIYSEFSTQSCYQSTSLDSDVLEINYCRSGRFECEFEHNRFIYMGEGDVTVSLMSNKMLRSSFPLGAYRGVAFMIYQKQAQEFLCVLPEDMRPDLKQIIRHLGLHTRPFGMRMSEQTELLFGKLYERSPQKQLGLLKLNVLEMLFSLGTCSPAQTGERQRYYTQKQVRAAKEIHALFHQYPERHYTLSELAASHGIGTTLLKNCFRDIYGCPLFTYLRAYRMQYAAQLLLTTERSVTDIACHVGYANPGKFAAAFRAYIGHSPLGYRKQARPLGAINDRTE